MNRNLFSMEMKRNLISLVSWAILISFLIVLTMSVFRTFVDNQSKILGMINLVPKGVLQFKGISSFDELFSVLGFYAVNNTIYMMVLGSIFAMVLSSNILLKEEYNKTAEYLLTRPLTRSEIFLSKSTVVLLNIFLLNLITCMAGLIAIELVKWETFNLNAFLILSLYTLLLNLMFGSIGIFMSTLVKKPKPITTLGIGMVLVFYFIYTLSKITEKAASVGYISPFRYVDVNVLSPDYKLWSWNLLYFVGISLVLTGISFRLYKRKDIYI
jgi:ABC-2 type transport system permease protein